MVLLTLVSVTAMQSVGTILIVAMLITPAATAYLYANSLWSMMLLSSSLGALASILGLFIGYSLNIAVGSCIVLTSAVFFLISFFIAPKQRKNKHALFISLKEKTMKKFTSILALFVALLLVCWPVVKGSSSGASDKLKVVTTNSILADITKI